MIENPLAIPSARAAENSCLDQASGKIMQIFFAEGLSTFVFIKIKNFSKVDYY